MRCLPKNILETLALHLGDKVNLAQKGHTIIEPCKPSLEELLAKVTDCNKHEAAVFNDRKGNELL